MNHEQGVNNQVQPAVLCLGFHRVLSSGVANWLHHAGLNMGQCLMPPAVSNPEGHYEDMAGVDLHDRLLQMNGTQWRFHDEVPFEAACRLDLLARYVQRRDVIVGGPWGAKDPRACLFADAWCRVLGERGRYLVLLCIDGEHVRVRSFVCLQLNVLCLQHLCGRARQSRAPD